MTSSDKEMLRYVPRLQKPLSVIVWAGISASGRTPLVFVPSGVKINASTYRELILEPVVKNLGQTVFNGKLSYSNKMELLPIPQILLKIGFAGISRGLSVKTNGLPIAQT